MGFPKTRIIFNLEGKDETAFYALYAGLRMYKEFKANEYANHPEGAFSIAGAEAYCFLEDLKDQFPEQYKDAEAEFNMTYEDTEFICPHCHKRIDPKI